MTEFSINQEFKNLDKKIISKQEQTTVIEERNNMTDNKESAKTEISFKIITLSKKNKR